MHDLADDNQREGNQPETERRDRGGPKLARIALLHRRYGPFLCAVTFAAYVKELRGAEMKWDKTEKTGKIA
jgi:hypothetical protein